MDKSLYPENWDEIAFAVKNEANWHCEDCGRPCRKPGQRWIDFAQALLLVGGWQQDMDKPSRFVLTTAHLDQERSNNDRRNLRALCSVCHLNHDRPFQQANRLAKRERRGQLCLLDLTAPAPAGHGKDPKRVQLPLRLEVAEFRPVSPQ